MKSPTAYLRVHTGFFWDFNTLSEHCTLGLYTSNNNYCLQIDPRSHSTPDICYNEILVHLKYLKIPVFVLTCRVLKDLSPSRCLECRDISKDSNCFSSSLICTQNPNPYTCIWVLYHQNVTTYTCTYYHAICRIVGNFHRTKLSRWLQK